MRHAINEEVVKRALPPVFSFFFGASGVALIWAAPSFVFRGLATGLFVSGVLAAMLAIRDLERDIKALGTSVKSDDEKKQPPPNAGGP